MSNEPDSPVQGPKNACGDLPLTLEWIGGADGCLHLIDQTLLPGRMQMRECTDVRQVWDAIRVLAVRGAPAIGVAAAYGLCLGTRPFRDQPPDVFRAKVREVGTYLCSSRPTAVNLAWAVERATGVAEASDAADSAALWKVLLDEAHAICREDIAACRRIGEVGAPLIPEGAGVLTHCNAGALATVKYGTALSPIYVAHEQGRRFQVFADETRPLMQGARLTSYELSAAEIDVTVLCDGAAAARMRAGEIQVVIVGADRIAANGDIANKIGTYSVAVAARHHGIPFYVAAPRSTFDLNLPNGDAIPIEQRAEDEIHSGFGPKLVPDGVKCHNQAFDVTPADLVSAIVTERGLVDPVSVEGVRQIFSVA